ncbi:peptidoglycan/xylan/chitin deacetylase (PgdA/CDA1 family) [Evansella vedderi]|uniref:Peptidoglycan/xylan/chitin deacetylase (PgdA/CDA1 family) n=1 Tax=Evansella vedderi TaxID=38282 RepID=A0ABT9ZQJ5_9BACI|nr:polysaccharide deacetylase family protein [Evansella vedderi]MDQ0253474.1 peptidoglycan/xylan/chitin deacetylase (PgdA/CDA1 family) [Evansella vedderi]
MVTDEVVYDLQDDRWLKNLAQLKKDQKKVVLTFDDGPGRHLNSILDILQQKNAPAMFFWQSRLLHPKRPWKRVLDEGHIIGSHAHNHKNLTNLSREQQYRQIKGSLEKIEAVTDQKVRYFRPPFGQYNEDTMDIMEELELTPVMWEISSYDWEHKEKPEKIFCNVIENIQPGSIILLHELEQTVSILPELIDEIKEKGYEISLP